MTRRHQARYLARQLPARLGLSRRGRRGRLRADRGAATAEYAVVSVAAVGLGGLLIKLLTSDWFMEIIRKIFETLLTMFFNAIGLG